GNNLGFSKALDDSADIIIAINNDTLVKEDFFEKVLSSPINKPEVGAIGGLIYFAPGFEFKDQYKKNEIGKVVWYAGGKFDWDNVLGSNDHVDEVDHGQFKKPEETAFITGALFITKGEVLRKVGLFDDHYFMYLEDVDLCQRIKLAGFKLIFDPNIKIWHKVAQASGIGSSLNDYFITRNRLLFGFKYTHFRTKFALFREAIRKLITGTSAQRTAILDFFSGRLGNGSFVKG
ncbi:glycosyltransferase family 2 protein, partial [Candidatus Collierbacteria bacterium]|nr:glycosyltransferase family 2 protein [Candidatus Collierbacteria bacterium]